MNAAKATKQFPTFHKAGALLLRAIKACAHRIQRLVLSRTSIKIYLITGTLICLSYTSLCWVGRRALQAEKQRVTALGMPTELSQLINPPIANEDNFFAAPAFTGLFTAKELQMWFSQNFLRVKTPDGKVEYRHLRDRKNDTLAEWCESLRWVGSLPTRSKENSPAVELLADYRWDHIIQAIYSAVSRPSAELNGEIAGVAPSVVLPGLFGSLNLYARAQLETGNADLAAPFFKANRHRVHALASRPESFAVSGASRALHAQKSLLLSGIASHQWPDYVLRELMDTNYPALFEAASRREMSFRRLNLMSHVEHASIPLAISARKGSAAELFWKLITPDYYFTTLSAGYSRFYEGLHTAARPLGNSENWNSRVPEVTSATPDAGWLLFGDQRQAFRVGHLDPIIRAALQHLSVMLELHYLSHKRYPATLEDLEPPLSSLLLMEIDGKKISYTTNPERTYFTLIPVNLNRLTDPRLRDQTELIYSTAPGRLPK